MIKNKKIKNNFNFYIIKYLYLIFVLFFHVIVMGLQVYCHTESLGYCSISQGPKRLDVELQSTHLLYGFHPHADNAGSTSRIY